LSFIPLIILTVAIYNKSQITLADKASRYYAYANKGIRTSVDSLLNQITDYTVDIVYDKHIQYQLDKFINNPKLLKNELYFLEKDIKSSLLDNSVLTNTSLLNIELVTKNNQKISCSLNDVVSSFKYPILLNDALKNKVFSSSGRLIWSNVGTEEIIDIGSKLIIGVSYLLLLIPLY